MTIWFFSDPHFGHSRLVHGGGTHIKEAGRPEFSSVDEMNDTILRNIMAVVKPQDHLYCLGDVAMDKEFVAMVNILPGHKRLILGNHDVESAKFYLQYFNKVMAYREFDGMMFSHIPIAPWSMKWRANVHGHCHLAKPLFYSATDPELVGFGRKAQYINISMEHTKYRPVSLETLSKWSRANEKTVDDRNPDGSVAYGPERYGANDRTEDR